MRRNEFDAGSQPVTNLMLNPAFEASDGTSVIATNIAQNPSFETTSGTVDVRTNLFTNPAFEATSAITDVRTNWVPNSSFSASAGSVNVRTNYSQNPSMETLNGTQTIRTNLAVNPRMTNANLGGYGSGTQTLSSVSAGVTANPELITTAVRVAYTAGASNPGVIVMQVPDISTTYTVSAWVYNEGPSTEDIAIALKGVASGGQQTVPVGVWKRLSWTMTTPAALGAGNDFGVRIGVAAGTGSFLTTGVLVEKTNALKDYFDGSITTTNLTPNPSFAADISSWTTISSSLTRVTTKGDGAVGELAQTTANGSRQAAIALFPFYQPVGTYTVSFDAATAEATLSQVRVLFYSPALVNTVHSAPITPVNLVAKDGTTFTRYSFTVTTTDTFDRIYIDFLGTAIPVGAKSWVDKVMIEKGTTAGAWYTGTGDFTFSWSGTANASSSLITAPKLFGFTNENGGTLYRDSMSQMTGVYSGKMLASSGDFYMSAATTTASAGWTFSLDYKTAGTLTGNPRLYISGGGASVTLSLPLTQLTPARFSVTLPATSPGVVQVVGAVFSATTGDFWVDNVLMEQTPVAQPYFDGSTAASGDFTYAWSGTAKASLSYQQAPGVANWLARWYGSTGGAGVFYQAKGGTSGYYGRKLWTQSNTGSSMDTGLNTGNITAWANTTYTLSAWVRCSVDQVYQFYVDWKDGGGTLLTSSRPTQTGVIPANTWTRIAITSTSPTNTAMAQFVIGPYNGATAMPAGATMDFDDVMAEIYPSTRDYFDTSNPLKNLCTNPSFDVDTSNWTASALQAGYGRQSSRSWTGTHSIWGVAVDPYGDSMFTNTVPYDVFEGATYTLSAYAWVPSGVSATDFRDGSRNLWAVAAANGVPSLVTRGYLDFTKTNQWQRVSTTITIPAGSTRLNIRLYFPANGAGIFWDGVMVEKASTLNPYYEGLGDFTYAWSGTANQSYSLQQAPRPSTVGSANQAVLYRSGTPGKYKARASFTGNTVTDSGTSFGSGVSSAPNKTYTMAVTLTSDIDRVFRFSAQGTGAVFASSGSISLSAGVPVRKVWSFSTTASGAFALYVLRADNSLGTLDMENLIIEEGTILNGGYFDGTKVDSNLITNSHFEVDASGWSADTGTPTLSTSTDRAYLGTKSLKAVSTVVGTDVAVKTSSFALKPLTTYTLSYYVNSVDARTLCYFDTAAANFTFNRAGSTSVAANTWTRISATFTTPANIGSSTVFYLHNGGGPNTTGAIVYIDCVLLEESDTLNQYYEGSGDFTYAWTGTAHASTSVQRGVAVTRATSDRAYAVSTTRNGDKVVRVIPSGKGNNPNAYTGTDVFINLYSQPVSLKPNTTYTVISTYINEAPLSAGGKFRFNVDSDQYSPVLATAVGEYTVNWKFSTGSTGAISFLRFMPGPSGVTGFTNEVILKNFALIEGPYDGTYFDGSTVSSGDFTYAWTGSANSSSSTISAPKATGWTSSYSGRYAWTSTDKGGKALAVPAMRPSVDAFSQTYSGVAFSIPNPANLGGRTFTVMGQLTTSEALPAGSDGRAWSIHWSVNKPGGSYQYSFKPTATSSAGTYMVRGFVTFPADVTDTAYIRLYNGSPTPGNLVYWDNIMIVEGTYNGDYIDGTTPFSKWNGTAHASTSTGYPPQFLDIAGKPFRDIGPSTINNAKTGADMGARTVYCVYETIGMTGNYNALAYYGDSTAGGRITFQTAPTNSNLMGVRLDFTNGEFNRVFNFSGGRSNRRHVLALTINNGITSFAGCLNGAADLTGTLNGGTGWNSDYTSLWTNTELFGMRFIVFYAEHDRATRLAVSRYLGNKYGASVA